MGDFNSHHELWNYETSDTNGEKIVEWAVNNNLHLMFDAKDHQTFRSRTWNGVYNPDLCFVTTDKDGNALPAVRKVYHEFPKSQHRPVFLTVGTQIPTIKSLPASRWNLKKADWAGFRQSIDRNVRWVKPDLTNYERFTGIIMAAAKKHIPRGYRKDYIPAWSSECENLWREYKENGDATIGTKILQTLNEERNDRWKSLVESMDFKHSSRKAWDLLRKLNGGSLKMNTTTDVTPNQIASRLESTSKMPIDKRLIKRINRKLRKAKSRIKTSPYGSDVTNEEVSAAITTIKPNRACGVDGIFPEFIINLGNRARKWLADFLTKCYKKPWTPKQWKFSKVRSVLKPGKPKNLVESYRPISLLCVCYKVFERIIHNRIANDIYANTPADQAGFIPERNCCDQVLALVTHIEAGFQDKRKTTTVFIDLTSAFDTVWKNALLLKLANVIKCEKTISLISYLLSNRMFKVFMGVNCSTARRLNSGLIQGGVLSPLLFVHYLADIPHTISRKFMFADDLALALQYKYDNLSERWAIRNLNNDLKRLETYYGANRLRANPSKTEVTTFHLSNQNASRKTKVKFCGKIVPYNFTPKYLGNTLDRSMTFKPHLTKLSGKLKSRCNIVQKLAGTTWGASASTLRTSALSLVYSTAEYCCPVWSHSAHTGRVDKILNECQRIISGTIKSTPTEWLPVLSNIMPSSIRRNMAVAKEAQKIYTRPSLPIHQDLDGRNELRLPSRKPFWTKANDIGYTNYSPMNEWLEQWESRQVTNWNLIEDPSCKVEGFDMKRRSWCQLNRIRTNHGRCNVTMHIWNRHIAPDCDCGHENQTIDHIVNECWKRKFSGGIRELNQVTDNAAKWLDELDIYL